MDQGPAAARHMADMCGGRQFRAPRGNNALRLLEAVLLAMGTVAAMLLLSYSLGTCVDVPKWHEKNYGFTLKCTTGAHLTRPEADSCSTHRSD